MLISLVDLGLIFGRGARQEFIFIQRVGAALAEAGEGGHAGTGHVRRGHTGTGRQGTGRGRWGVKCAVRRVSCSSGK